MLDQDAVTVEDFAQVARGNPHQLEEMFLKGDLFERLSTKVFGGNKTEEQLKTSVDSVMAIANFAVGMESAVIPYIFFLLSK